MKQRLLTLVYTILFLPLASCGKSGSTLPPLGALAALPENRLSEALQGHSRDSLILGYGKVFVVRVQK